MKILITNDDGIFSAGIEALWRALVEFADVTIAAPDRERSAMSQAITVAQPILVDRYELDHPRVTAWKVGGTPTDCVKFALEAGKIDKPDVLVSGINHGPNIGTDVLYSGTVSAAIEGALHGIPSIAVSLDSWGGNGFETAASYAATLVKKIATEPLPAGTLLNVNVPALPAADIKGMAMTKLGQRLYANAFHERKDPRGRTYYWIGGTIIDAVNDADTDVAAVQAGLVSITPIHFDLTNYAVLKQLQEWTL